MKELTYEDWQKNPTPRMMCVWDDEEEAKEQRKVIYFSNPKLSFPIIALNSDETCIYSYAHCAEIEKQKQRRRTNKELAQEIMEMRKRIAELEKENAELKLEFSALKTSDY